MNVAITGTSGFIGDHLSAMIVKMGHNVIYINRKQSHQAHKNYFTYEDFFSLRLNLKLDCFLHLASPNYDYDKTNSNDLEEGISILTDRILSVLGDYNCKKFIFFSSAKIYGEPSIDYKKFFTKTLLLNLFLIMVSKN